jgi:hypothetical protein
MRARSFFALALILAFVASLNAQDSPARRSIAEGHNRLRSGDRYSALLYYNQARQEAAQTRDPYVMAWLAGGYLVLGEEQAAVDCYSGAVRFAYDQMYNADRSSPQYAAGFNALQYAINHYTSVLSKLPASTTAREKLSEKNNAAKITLKAHTKTNQSSPEQSARARPSGNTSPKEPDCSRKDTPNYDDLACAPYTYRTPNVK